MIQEGTTPLPVIANVSRVVTTTVDRLTGDRSDYPLLVACAGVEALRLHGIESRVMYGQAAWIEVLENEAIQWAGCWGESIYFWIATSFGEVVDLNASVAFRKRAHSQPFLRPIASPPILWSVEVPRFFRYQAEGVAEIELTESTDRERLERVLAEVRSKCGPSHITGTEPEFPNEPILCPGRRLLDDSRESFKRFDRAVAIAGIPKPPF